MLKLCLLVGLQGPEQTLPFGLHPLKVARAKPVGRCGGGEPQKPETERGAHASTQRPASLMSTAQQNKQEANRGCRVSPHPFTFALMGGVPC